MPRRVLKSHACRPSSSRPGRSVSLSPGTMTCKAGNLRTETSRTRISWAHGHDPAGQVSKHGGVGGPGSRPRRRGAGPVPKTVRPDRVPGRPPGCCEGSSRGRRSHRPPERAPGNFAEESPATGHVPGPSRSGHLFQGDGKGRVRPRLWKVRPALRIDEDGKGDGPAFVQGGVFEEQAVPAARPDFGDGGEEGRVGFQPFVGGCPGGPPGGAGVPGSRGARRSLRSPVRRLPPGCFRRPCRWWNRRTMPCARGWSTRLPAAQAVERKAEDSVRRSVGFDLCPEGQETLGGRLRTEQGRDGHGRPCPRVPPAGGEIARPGARQIRGPGRAGSPPWTAASRPGPSGNGRSRRFPKAARRRDRAGRFAAAPRIRRRRSPGRRGESYPSRWPRPPCPAG